MLSCAGLWQPAVTTGRNLPQSMRMMKTAMVTMTSYLRKTRPPCHLHILSGCGQLHPLHWIPCQGRPFLPESSCDSNCSLIAEVLVPKSPLITFNYVQYLTELSISQCSIMTSCYVINGSCVKHLPQSFILVKRQ